MAPWCVARCTPYFDTQLHGILPWADINRNCNIFFVGVHLYIENMNSQVCHSETPVRIKHIWCVSTTILFFDIDGFFMSYSG